MSLSLLGASIGTLIKGTECYNKDLLLRLHSDIAPWDSYEGNYDVYEIVRLARRLRSQMFANMADNEILNWLSENRRPGGGKGNKYFPDDTLVEVIESAGEKSKLPPSIVTGVMSVGEIQDALDKPTLSFYYNSWDIVVHNYEIPYMEAAGNVAIFDGRLTRLDEPIIDATYYRANLNGERIFLVGIKSDPDFIPEIVGEMNLEREYETLRSCTKYFTPAGYKSLLQKLIRVRPETLKIVDEEGEHLIDASDALVLTFIILYESNGSFVPDLGKFVSGKESALKRLAVSIMEDSYTPDMGIIAELFNDALIVQLDKTYGITREKFVRYLNVARKAIRESRYFKYSTKDPGVIRFSEVGADDSQKLSAYLLQTLGSFKGDIALVKTSDVGAPLGTKDAPPVVDIYNVGRCIDHHWQPSFAYLFPHEFVRGLAETGASPLNRLMNYIWDNSSGYNSRKGIEPPTDKWNMIGNLQDIWNLYNLGLYDVVKKGRRVIEGEFTKEFELPEAAVAVKVGLHYRKGAMICLSSNNIYKVSTSIIPSRDSCKGGQSAKLSLEAEEDAIAFFKTKLKKGINGVKLVGDDEYTIDGMTVKEFLKQKVVAKLFEYDGPIAFSYDPEETDMTIADVDFKRRENGFDKGEINRARYHIMSGDEYIVMPSISRDGGNVSKYDVGAYHFLNRLSIFYPFAIRQERIGKFRVYPVLFELFKKAEAAHIAIPPILPFDRDHRVPFEHQKEAIEELDKNVNNFLWIPVGMGKTYIVISHIVSLLSRGLMDKYLIYTLPGEAMLSVQHEFEKWGIEVNIMKPLKGISWMVKEFEGGTTKKGCPFFVVNMINHDHLRRINYELEPYMENTFYIVDEVHKTLAATQRSDVAQTLAALSDRFIVLTGTPVINNKLTMLIGWIKMTVNYRVNKNNFWLAISSLISKQVNTGVKVIKREIYSPMTDDERVIFNRYVGPNLGGTNGKVSSADIMSALDVAYRVVDREMVKIIAENVDDGVFVVARNKEHQERLREMLVAKIPRSKIGLMSKDNLFNLAKKSDKGPDVVITTVSQNAGYTLTKLGTMVTSVYFSNLAVREQLEGRINRITQERETVNVFVVFTDLLDLVLKNYNYVSGVASMAKMLSE